MWPWRRRYLSKEVAGATAQEIPWGSLLEGPQEKFLPGLSTKQSFASTGDLALLLVCLIFWILGSFTEPVSSLLLGRFATPCSDATEHYDMHSHVLAAPWLHFFFLLLFFLNSDVTTFYSLVLCIFYKLLQILLGMKQAIPAEMYTVDFTPKLLQPQILQKYNVASDKPRLESCFCGFLVT